MVNVNFRSRISTILGTERNPLATASGSSTAQRVQERDALMSAAAMLLQPVGAVRAHEDDVAVVIRKGCPRMAPKA
ncbi:hypothetical protein GCM10007170_40880 [Arthrobacter liuii]|uniref:Uncharacterized protein n=1 Tax=Arthrobacter liuii TaxID=1476996 RepID=A0ABQ2AZS7_9MICC|nr:hypothetical protein GCM10007170_40880 [Arthrobacter liuii]